jgi:hypothetical protein
VHSDLCELPTVCRTRRALSVRDDRCDQPTALTHSLAAIPSITTARITTATLLAQIVSIKRTFNDQTLDCGEPSFDLSRHHSCDRVLA